MSNTRSPPPPVPQHSPKRRSHAGSITSSAAIPPPPIIQASIPPPVAPSGIPPPPVLMKGANSGPPPPPKRLSSSESSGTPPPPPVRRNSKKTFSNSSLGSAVGVVPPPPPPHHKAVSSWDEGKRTSGTDVAGRDYDIPRGAKTSSRAEIPAVPQPSAQVGPTIRQASGEPPRGMDYDIPLSKEERLRKEKVSSMLAHKTRCGSESSSDASRPVSVTSSVYSADASSVSLNSSRSSSKLTLPKDEEYEHSKSRTGGLVSQSSFEQQMEIIDQLVDDIAEQNAAKRKKSCGIAEESTSSGDGFELPTLGKVSSARSSNSEDSSHSSSQENLGVWDDVHYEEEDSDDLEGTCVSLPDTREGWWVGRDRVRTGREGGRGKGGKKENVLMFYSAIYRVH